MTLKNFIGLTLIIAILGFGLINCNEKNELPLSATASKTDPSCQTCNDGSIDLTIVGGTAPYSIVWSTNAVTEDIESLTIGTYSYTITDANLDELKGTVELTYFHELVKIETDFGDILIWLYDQTPLHKANFLKLSKDGFYDGLIFHRVIDEFMIQGGDPLGTGMGGPGYDITAEILPTIKHELGSLGAARNNNPEKKSNGSQFYIVENKNGTPHLDNLYTVFGIVVNGINAVHSIADVATGVSDRPVNDVVMKEVTVVSYTASELETQFSFIIP